MPGLVGLISRMRPEDARTDLRRMLGTGCHERFYTSGTWTDEAQGLYVGWTAHVGSFGESMPVKSERGDIILMFAGEDFSDSDILRTLKANGHSFAPTGAEYLVHLYEACPAAFLSTLNGRFHGLLIDLNRQTAVLFTDRYGLQRLYCHESKEGFYFAAEAKALMAVRPELRRLDPRGVGEFLTTGCVLQNRALFTGIDVVPGAAAWTFRNGQIANKTTYFSPSVWEQQSPINGDAYYDQLREVLARRVPRYFDGPQRLGVSLTGGLDTRMVLAWHKPAPSSIPCYTFSGMFRDNHDARVARRVANAWNQPHQIIRVAAEFITQFPRYAERAIYLSDGCVDVSRAADLYINEKAREIAPVRLTGNFGGEILRGVRAFKPSALSPALVQPELLRHMREAELTYGECLNTHPVSFGIFRQAPWHHYGLLALEQTQVTLRSPFLDNELVRTVFQAPDAVTSNANVCLKLINDGCLILSQIPTDRGGGRHGIFTSGLTKRLLDLQFRTEYLYDYGMPTWLVAIDQRLSALEPERLFLGHHKFLHYRFWYRNALSGYVREILLDRRTMSRSYLNPAHVRASVESHVRGERNLTLTIHRLLALELIQRLFTDHPIDEGPSSAQPPLSSMAFSSSVHN